MNLPKFRAYRIDKNRWFTDVLAVLDNGEVWSLVNGELYENFTNEVKDSKTLKLMQSTGLKDKNGVEIYENDILKITNTSRFLIAGQTCYSEVKIMDGHIYVWVDPIIEGRKSRHGAKLLFNGIAKHIGMQGVATGDVEVVGNIWEHPELLEVDE